MTFDEAHDFATRNPTAIAWSDMLVDITRKAQDDSFQPTERQAEVYIRLITNQVERSARRAKEDAEAAAAPILQSGRQQVTGRFVSCRVKDTPYGEQLKGLFKCQDGNKLWLSVPAQVQVSAGDCGCEETELTVTMSVQVTAKEDHFGFGNRPTKVEVAQPQPEALEPADDVNDAAAYEAERINEQAYEDRGPGEDDIERHADYAAPIGNMPEYAAHVQDTKLSVLWSERNGTPHNETLDADDARQILAKLEEAERETAETAPTDSGATRFAYQARARAIKVALLRAGLPIT